MVSARRRCAPKAIAVSAMLGVAAIVSAGSAWAQEEPSTTSTTAIPACLPDGSVPEGAESCIDDVLPDPLPTTTLIPACLPDGSVPEGAESCIDDLVSVVPGPPSTTTAPPPSSDKVVVSASPRFTG
jgi:hypothetical protein